MCVCVSLAEVGGVVLHPLLLCLLHRFVGLFLLWEQTVALFHLFSPALPLFSLYPTDTSLPFLSSIHLPPLYPHSSPEAMGEGEREGETGQPCTVENIVYARHKAACNFCSRGDTHKGHDGEEREAVGSKATDADGQEVKQN